MGGAGGGSNAGGNGNKVEGGIHVASPLRMPNDHKTVESEVVAEAAVAAAMAKAAVAVTSEVEDVEVGSVIVLIEFATIMEEQAVMVVMRAAEEEVLDITGMEIMLSQNIHTASSRNGGGGRRSRR